MKLITTIVLIAGCTYSAVADNVPSELKKLQAIRAKKVQEIDSAYIKALENLKDKYMKKGDLDAANTVNNELKQFGVVNQSGQEGISERTTNSLDIDITERSKTDPLLVINTNPRCNLLPADNIIFRHLGYDVKLQYDRRPLSYEKLWGKENVFICLNTENNPATVDFSNITLLSKGTLEVYARNHPKGAPRLIMLLNNKEIEDEQIDGNKWERFRIKYDHESVVLECHKLSPTYGHCFLSYSIKK